MSSPLVAPPVAKPKALYCPNCGGPVEQRGFGYSITIVCQQCRSVLDASTPLLKVLQQADAKQRQRNPLIPLGTRGKWGGANWEVIGYQVRGVVSEGVMFEWEEYLLFNPYAGFRYLTQYNGHWNWVNPLEPMPELRAQGGRPGAVYEGQAYKHFSGADAFTTFVLGEFPWRVKSGDRVRADDFIAPPLILSAEKSDKEVTWSQGTYVPGVEIWKAFSLPGSAPPARGVYLNQPSPFTGTIGSIWGVWLLLTGLLLGLMLFFLTFSKNEVVLREAHHFSPSDTAEPSFVTKEFELEGRPANLQLDVSTNLNNNWAYFNFALINSGTGDAYDFGREVSYYNGSDSDGAWTEGSTQTSVLIPAVPAGRYYLRVEPEMDDSGKGLFANSVNYDLTLRHDVPSYLWFLIAGGFLLFPPILRTIRARAFEQRRWAESDYAPSSGDSGGDDSSDD